MSDLPIYPELSDAHWGQLPFPYADMESAQILLRLGRVGTPYSARLMITRDEGCEDRFTTVVHVSDIETGVHGDFAQDFIRLDAEQQSAICIPSPPVPHHPYELSLPYTFFGPLPPPRQLRRGL